MQSAVWLWKVTSATTIAYHQRTIITFLDPSLMLQFCQGLHKQGLTHNSANCAIKGLKSRNTIFVIVVSFTKLEEDANCVIKEWNPKDTTQGNGI